MAKKAATKVKIEAKIKNPDKLGPWIKRERKRQPVNQAAPLMRSNDLTNEVYREYQFAGQVYRIDNPVKLFYAPGGTTHRVLDAEGIVHCVPTVGERGCILRWKPRKITNACQF